MKTFKARKEIILDDVTIKPGDKICCTKENWIMLPDGTIVFYPFDRFCSEHVAEGELASDKFEVKKAIPLGDITLEPGCIISRTVDNWIMLANRKVVYYPFDRFCSEHEAEGVFVW